MTDIYPAWQLRPSGQPKAGGLGPLRPHPMRLLNAANLVYVKEKFVLQPATAKLPKFNNFGVLEPRHSPNGSKIIDFSSFNGH
jgi:hypothetical protein